jgi:hypothetical protein
MRVNFQRIVKLFTQKVVKNMGLWDPGSGKTYSGSGSRGQKGTGSRIRNTSEKILMHDGTRAWCMTPLLRRAFCLRDDGEAGAELV